MISLIALLENHFRQWAQCSLLKSVIKLYNTKRLPLTEDMPVMNTNFGWCVFQHREMDVIQYCVEPKRSFLSHLLI